MKCLRSIVAVAALYSMAPFCYAGGADLSVPSGDATGVAISTNQRNAHYSLTITGGPGVAIRREFDYGGTIYIKDALPDGQYSWELRVGASQGAYRSEQQATASMDEWIPTAAEDASDSYVQWGHFHVVNGAYVVPDNTQE